MRKQIVSLVKNFARDERGASLLEYTILLGLITAISVSLVSGVGTWISTQWTTLQTSLGISTPTP